MSALMTTVFRPTISGVGKELALAGGQYLVLALMLCISLSLWAVGPVTALLIFVGIVGLMTLAFAFTFRRSRITVTDTTITQSTIWGEAERVVSRSELARVIRVDRIKGTVPVGVLLLVDRNRERISVPSWLWNDELVAQLTAALADGRVRPEHYPTARLTDILRDFGSDPALRRQPVRRALVLMAVLAAAVLIVWPLLRLILDLGART